MAQELRNRRFAPAAVEIRCAAASEPLQVRVYFLNGEFQAYPIQPYTTIADLRALVVKKIGLSADKINDPYALFEIFGLDDNLSGKAHLNLPVADILFKWEKFATTQKSMEVLRLTLKRGPVSYELVRPSAKMEFNLGFCIIY